MPEAVKQFSFNAGWEDWAFNAGGGTGLTSERDVNDDSPNDPDTGNGNLEATRSGKNLKDGTPYITWYGTWESLGVPAGATVTAVNLDYDWRCSLYTTGANTSSTGPAELRSEPEELRGTFSAELTFGAVSNWATRSGTAITGLSDPSNTVNRLRIGANPETGNSASAKVELRQDWIVVTVTYSAATTHYGSATITGQGTLEAAGSRMVNGAGTITGTGAISASGIRGCVGIATLTGTGVLDAAAWCLKYGLAALVGSGDIAAVGWATKFGLGVLTGAGDLVATGDIPGIVVYGSALLSGAGDVAAAGWGKSFGAATLAGLGGISGTAVRGVLGASTLTGTGDAMAIGQHTVIGVATLTGLGQMTGTGKGTAFGQALLAGTGGLTATAEGTAGWWHRAIEYFHDDAPVQVYPPDAIGV